MSFPQRPQDSSSASSAERESREEFLRRAMQEKIAMLMKHYPRELEEIRREVENGHIERARKLLRGLGGLIDEGYVEPLLRALQNTTDASRTSFWEALEGNPHALRILLRSGNRSEAIEFYQRVTGVDWPVALAAIKDLEQKLAAEDAQ